MENKDIIKIESQSANKLIINYRITEKCNYKCPYCWFKGREPVNIEGDLPKIRNVFKNLEVVVNYYIKQGKKINLFLTGGEPSLYPLSFYDNLFKLIATKKFEKVTLSTNFSADKDWFKGFADNCKNNTVFEIKAAYHPSGCDLDEYIAKIKDVKDCADKFIAHFTFDDNNFIGMDKIDEIKALGVTIDVVPIHSKKDADYGAFAITNPDLLSLIAKKGTEKKYNIYYKDGTIKETTVNFIKEMDFSLLTPVCYHSNITIMLGKIGINCEYMRSIKRINPDNWLDISVEKSEREIYNYLKNDCCIKCNKKDMGMGNNCTPSVLKFSSDNILKKLCKFIKNIV